MIDKYGGTSSGQEPSTLFNLISKFVELIKITDYVSCGKSGTFKRSSQAIAMVNEMFDLLTSKFASPGKLRKHLLAVSASLSDHFTTLLFCEFNLCLGIGDRVGTLTRNLNFC
ncbi:MAG: hypothetical protein EBQ75_01295, partial [Actinobacteria bacterium]|nr:hypothetical protein [Actinomycetota bacterium]